MTEEECMYRSMFGKRYIFYFQDIQKGVFNPKNMECQYRLYGYNGKCLAKFESNMRGASSAYVLSFLKEHGILVEKNTKLNFIEKYTLKSERGDAEQEIIDIQKKWGIEKINDLKKVFRCIQVANVVLLAISVIFLSLRETFIMTALTPMFWFGVYLFIYPMMVAEFHIKDKSLWRQTHMEMPYIPVFLSMLICVVNIEYINIQNYDYFLVLVFIFTFILLGIFIIVAYFRQGTVKIIKVFCVFITMLTYSYIFSYAYHWVLRVQEPMHETVKVIEKRKTSGRSGNSYYFTVNLHDGTTIELNVSSSVYKAAVEDENVQLCKRESVLGVKYWYVHL